MAQIRIERKGHPYWPWVLAALALIAIVILAVAWLRPAREEPIESPTGLGPASPSADQKGSVLADPQNATALGSAPDTHAGQEAVRSYLAFAQSDADMSLAHAYTSNGIRQLAAALEAVPGAPVPSLSSRLGELRARADVLQRDPTSLRHADVARQAFLEAADLLADMAATEERSGVGGARAAAGAPRRAAESIRADLPLTEQGVAVEAFFDASAEALRALSEAG